MGLQLAVLRTDGRQPVGVGIGPALEARDVLAVLRGEAGAPADLRERALAIAGALLDLTPGSVPGQGWELATRTLDSGQAWRKFLAICEAQGGFTEPGVAPYQADVLAPHAGRVQAIDNRRLAKVAKLAGAPGAALAGLTCSLRLGDQVAAGATAVHRTCAVAGRTRLRFGLCPRQPGYPDLGGPVSRVILSFPELQSQGAQLARLLQRATGAGGLASVSRRRIAGDDRSEPEPAPM